MHAIRYQAEYQTSITRHGRYQRTMTSLATVTCACGLHTGPVPAERAHDIAETHADEAGIPDPLRPLRHFFRTTR